MKGSWRIAEEVRRGDWWRYSLSWVEGPGMKASWREVEARYHETVRVPEDSPERSLVKVQPSYIRRLQYFGDASTMYGMTTKAWNSCGVAPRRSWIPEIWPWILCCWILVWLYCAWFFPLGLRKLVPNLVLILQQLSYETLDILERLNFWSVWICKDCGTFKVWNMFYIVIVTS